jgi:hypothetical protein
MAGVPYWRQLRHLALQESRVLRSYCRAGIRPPRTAPLDMTYNPRYKIGKH